MKMRMLCAMSLLAGSAAFATGNDHWTTAQLVVIGGGGGVIEASTSLATDMTGAYGFPTQCEARDDSDYANIGHGPDLWYRVELTEEIPLHAQTCGSSFNTMVGIWDAGLNLLAASDEHCLHDAIACCYVGPGTFYVSVDGPTAADHGDFNLQIVNSPCSWETVEAAEQAVSFGLRPAHPNPFNPSTVLSYMLPETSEASLILYNLGGQQLRVLASGLMEAGQHDLRVDMSGLPSGLYLARLSSSFGVETQKLLLTR